MWGEWRKGWKSVGGECGGGVRKCVGVWGRWGAWKNVGKVECVEKCGGGVGKCIEVQGK